jgi:hypothetical protein
MPKPLAPGKPRKPTLKPPKVELRRNAGGWPGDKSRKGRWKLAGGASPRILRSIPAYPFYCLDRSLRRNPYREPAWQTIKISTKAAMKILPQRQEISLIALIAAFVATLYREPAWQTIKVSTKAAMKILPQRQEISLIALIAAFVATLIGNRLGKRRYRRRCDEDPATASRNQPYCLDRSLRSQLLIGNRLGNR